jgi:hypothetical protein
LFRPKTLLAFGIALAAIGIVGAIYYGSPIKNVIPVELEVAFVVAMLVGFGILSYGVVATKFNKPTDFYPI